METKVDLRIRMKIKFPYMPVMLLAKYVTNA